METGFRTGFANVPNTPQEFFEGYFFVCVDQPENTAGNYGRSGMGEKDAVCDTGKCFREKKLAFSRLKQDNQAVLNIVRFRFAYVVET